MRTIYLSFILLISLSSFAQSNYEISFNNEGYQQFIKHPKTKFKDSIAAISYLKDLQYTAISKGFPLASIDTIFFKKGHAFVDFYLGPEIKSILIEIDPEELKFIRKHSRINERLISQLPFSPQSLSGTMKKMHKVYLDNGYPFSSLQLKHLDTIEDSFKTELDIQRGPFYRWIKIHVKGDSSISEKYISNLINVRKGDVYSETNVSSISSKLDQIPFVREIKPAEVLFTKKGAELFLYLESVPVSSVNGIIGFQPNPDSKRLALTGELNLKLLDVFKRGELLDIKWQSIQEQTQSFEGRLNYPFLFNTPFGIDVNFDMYKRDTSFLELGTTAGIQFFLRQGSYIKAFYRFNSSNILSGGKNNPVFSDLGNTKSNNYGIAYEANRVDYLPNPSRGYNILVEGMSGIRSSQINDTTIPIKSTTYRGKLKAEVFLPLTRRHVIRIGSLTDFYSADEIFQNEVYRYGGLSSQRGFNEDQLFATTKTTGTIEYRFLLDKNSHVFAFFDQSWYENNSSDYYNDSPYGFGLGFSFSTNFGVFSISYALGKQLSNPILISNSKVHFGYIAYF